MGMIRRGLGGTQTHALQIGGTIIGAKGHFRRDNIFSILYLLGLYKGTLPTREPKRSFNQLEPQAPPLYKLFVP
jgi:hypothetical protein